MAGISGRIGRLVAAVLAGLAAAAPASAQRGTAGPIDQPNLDAEIDGAEEWLARREAEGWLLRGQFTGVLQGNARFRSPYQGESSLSPKQSFANTQSLDIVLGRRLWNNAEVIAVPSLTRGFGLSNARGAAAFPNNEAFRVGTTDPYAFMSRLFVRQTIDLSADAAPGADPDPMRFAGPLARERITITLGKVSTWDFFDDNRYAHDARSQFLNWALVGAGAVDFAADARGFTNGAVLEWENGRNAVRTGAFMVARNVNGLSLDTSIGRAWQWLAQVEQAWSLRQRPGVLRVFGGLSRTRSVTWNRLTSAVEDGLGDTEALRGYRTKGMVGFNLEQEVTDSLGVFARFGWNDGRAQNWMFTEMDWSASGGLAVSGQGWGRAGDTVGAAFNVGGLSASHRRFLEAGGIGFLTGDGKLAAAPEVAFEAYYDVRLAPGLNLTTNGQLLVNPAYNADRGPVPLLALRLHAAF
ncbi:carbohydrate porin [Paeniroseomonas aquatica]|uniref:Carbohydrate porin n=2 Tax=Paeniroseomonas aquatica TaxID=373043 RepID=A0ABT8A2R5_9PROT|nr:carbohydrate porin [Paeniroseomonas aquatica]MDN3563803.1 carbohydrate porin [Paeniroseomonas aquatica]